MLWRAQPLASERPRFLIPDLSLPIKIRLLSLTFQGCFKNKNKNNACKILKGVLFLFFIIMLVTLGANSHPGFVHINFMYQLHSLSHFCKRPSVSPAKLFMCRFPIFPLLQAQCLPLYSLRNTCTQC